MTGQNSAGVDEQLPEEAIAAYLQQNPEFFTRHPDLTVHLRVPHECGDATSLITYQVDRLRDENRKLKGRLDELLQVARDNDRLADQLHRLTLELMDSQDLDGLLQTLKDGLRHQFESDLMAIALFPEEFAVDDQDCLTGSGRDAFADLLASAQPRLGRLGEEQAQALFGHASTRLGSAAVVPISDNHDVTGVLAVGSFDADRFDPSQGTVFLRQLGQLAGRALRPYRQASAQP